MHIIIKSFYISKIYKEVTYNNQSYQLKYSKSIWMPPSLSELPPIIFDMKLTHLGKEASISEIAYNSNDNNVDFSTE